MLRETDPQATIWELLLPEEAKTWWWVSAAS